MSKDIQINTDSPIGIFDSGLGGLSIWKELNALLPNENTIYLADSKNAPYGDKSKEDIIAFSIKNTELLISMGCKLIIVACNTATTNAIKILREKFDVPFIGIEPAIKPAALQSETHKIGILATKGTLSSELFISTAEQFRVSKDIIEVEGTGLVRLIENGEISQTEELLRKYLAPMLSAGVDNIVLGCTHYPFLIPIIQKIVPETVNIIDSGKAVARQTKNVLSEKKGLNSSNENISKNIFYTNASEVRLKQFLDQIGLNKKLTEYRSF